MVIDSVERVYNMGRPHKLTPNEIQKAVDDYFSSVDKRGTMPSVSGLSLCLGVDMDTMRRWCTSKKRAYAEVARTMYTRLVSYWEPLLADNKTAHGAAFWLRCVATWRDQDPKVDKTEVSAGGVRVRIIRDDIPDKK